MPSSSTPWRATCSVVSKGEVLVKAFENWKNVDSDTGKPIEEKVRAGSSGDNPGGEPGQAKAEASAPIVETNTHAG